MTEDLSGRLEPTFEERQAVRVTYAVRWVIRGLLSLYVIVGLWAFFSGGQQASSYPGRFFEQVEKVSKSGPLDPHHPDIYGMIWEPLSFGLSLFICTVALGSVIIVLVAMNFMNYRL